MLITLSDQQPKRVLCLPHWRRIWITVLNGQIRIGTNQQEVQQQMGLNFDGTPFDPANANPFVDWWNGELWLVSATPNAALTIVTPGKEPRTF